MLEIHYPYAYGTQVMYCGVDKVYVGALLPPCICTQGHVHRSRRVESSKRHEETGREMVTGSVESPDPQGPSTKLFLGGLPPGVTDEDLRQHFETFGKVDEAVVKQPQGTSLQSHFGFLWVRPAEAARQIIAQDHTIHCASGLSVTIPAPVLARSTPLSTAWHCPQPAGPPEGSSQPESRYGLLPRRRPASTNQPLVPRWPALHACFFD